jgi:secreted PhoX family phosphatase
VRARTLNPVTNHEIREPFGARNDFTDAGRDVEFTGPVYAPDGRILFANIQEPGYTFAITGPWRAHRS